MDWWSEEIAWIFGQNIIYLNKYKETDRVERGTAVRLTVEERHVVWDLFKRDTEWLEENGAEDYDNPTGKILNSITKSQTGLSEELQYDHVMVDEVQDFGRSWLLVVAKIPRISLCLAGDLAQKIYRRNFSGASVGIEVRGGRSRRLSNSHRTTL